MASKTVNHAQENKPQELRITNDLHGDRVFADRKSLARYAKDRSVTVAALIAVIHHTQADATEVEDAMAGVRDLAFDLQCAVELLASIAEANHV